MSAGSLLESSEWFDSQPNIEVPESEYKRLLGYPADHALDGRPRELAESAREWYARNGRPWICARLTDRLEFSRGQLIAQGTAFTSRHLHDQFAAAEVHQAVVLAVSAGAECEARAHELWQEGKPDEYFFLEVFGSAVTEHLVAAASGRICAWADQHGMAALRHYSPGYTGWDITDQVKIWSILRQGDARAFPGTLRVLESGMLQPKKSQLAFVGITSRLDRLERLSTYTPCTSCSLARCQFRRAPYRDSLPQFEEVRALQPRRAGIASATKDDRSTPIPVANYSTNVRALRKWSEERLELKSLPDGSIEARFRYEGSTCSDAGRPLTYEYHLKLGSADEAYAIRDTRCVPAPGDRGHLFQCEHQKDPERFLRTTAAEAPLLGQPLSDVLTWHRPYSPSGCYCDATSRLHKWGLVLEVVHYALTQRERESAAGDRLRVGTATTAS